MRIIGNTITLRDNQKLLWDENYVLTIVSLLELHCKNSEILFKALKILTSITQNNEQCMILLESGTLGNVIKTFNETITSNVASESFELLTYLAKADCEASERICNQGALVISVLEKFHKDKSVITSGMVIINKFRVSWRIS